MSTVGRPSPLLRAIQSAVRRGLMPRGYGYLLRVLPSRLLGGEGVLVETEVGPMGLPTNEPSALGLLLFGAIQHERRESRLGKQLAIQSQAAIDVGAHYGWYSRLFSLAAPACKVICVEPDPTTYQYLLQNTAELGNAFCLNIAVGRLPGPAILWRASSRDLSSTVRQVGPGMSVEMDTIDQICARLCFSQTVGFIKCDVEGGESEVVAGAAQTLAGRLPPIWMLEVSDAFSSEAGQADVDHLRNVLIEASPGGRTYTQDLHGWPVEIASLRDRQNGNNIFFVPDSRSNDFEAAAERAFG